jgi:hypothetical protein
MYRSKLGLSGAVVALHMSAVIWSGVASAAVVPISVTGFNENMVLAATASWPGSEAPHSVAAI